MKNTLYVSQDIYEYLMDQNKLEQLFEHLFQTRDGRLEVVQSVAPLFAFYYDQYNEINYIPFKPKKGGVA